MSTLGIKKQTICDHTFIVEGSVKSAGLNTLIDTNKNWPINVWAGKKVSIWNGKGAGQSLLVLSNTNDTLFLQHNWTIKPDITSLYRGIITSNDKYCLKCGGLNSYIDSSFEGGKLKTLTGIYKLAQSVETMILTPRGSSIFTSQLGSGAELVLSSDIDTEEEVIAFVQSNINEALGYLSQIQNQNLQILDFDDSEVIGQLRDLEVTIDDTTDPRILHILADVIALNRQPVPVSSPLNIR